MPCENSVHPSCVKLNWPTGMFTAGDSVVGIPARKSGLISKIGALLPQYSMNIAVSGKLGVRMFVLRSRLERILKAEVPDVVILYSDSDLSNQNEDPLSIQEKFVLREHYRANFTLIVEAILATNAKLALSGSRYCMTHPSH